MTPRCFVKQMEFLARRNYQVLTLAEAVRERTACSIKKAVSLTFDDGYANFYTEVFPILKDYRFPATVFVVTDWIAKKKHFSLEQIKEMEPYGITIGSHSCSHRYLPELSLSQAKEEIFRSKEVLEEKLRHAIHFFSYPYGGFTRENVDLVRKAGYQASFTTNREFERGKQDFYVIRRIRMSATTNPLHLWARCSGYYDLWRRPDCPC